MRAWWLAALATACSAGCGCNGGGPVASGGGGAATPDGGGAIAPRVNGNGPPVAAAKKREDPTPPPLRAIMDRLQVLMEREAVEAVRAEVDAECERHPDDPVAWYATTLVRSELEMRRVGETPAPDVATVRTALARARELDPTGRLEWLGRYCDGRVARLSDDPKGAAEAAQDCVRLAPGFVRGRAELAQLYLLDKRPEPALELLTQDVREWPDRVELWVALASVHFAKKDAQRAVECLETAVKLRDDIFHLRFQRLQLLVQIWREAYKPEHETRIRVELAALKELAGRTWQVAANRERALAQIGGAEEQFETAAAGRKLRDLEGLPAAERTRSEILGRVTQEDARRFLVQSTAVMIGDGSVKDPTVRVRFLLECLDTGGDPAEGVRIDAVRGLVFDARQRDRRDGRQTPWPPEILALVRPVALPTLLTYAVDAGSSRTLRNQVLVAARILAEPDSAAVAPVHARIVVVAAEFLEARGKGNGADPSGVYDELSGLAELAQRLLGEDRALPGLPHHREDGDEQFSKWLERVGNAVK